MKFKLKIRDILFESNINGIDIKINIPLIEIYGNEEIKIQNNNFSSNSNIKDLNIKNENDIFLRFSKHLEDKYKNSIFASNLKIEKNILESGNFQDDILWIYNIIPKPSNRKYLSCEEVLTIVVSGNMTLKEICVFLNNNFLV